MREIINFNEPVCKKCVYYRNSITGPTFGTCKQFGVKDVVTGNVFYNYAEICRTNENKCGQKGKFFKPEKQPKLFLRNLTKYPYIFLGGFIVGNLIGWSILNDSGPFNS